MQDSLPVLLQQRIADVKLLLFGRVHPYDNCDLFGEDLAHIILEQLFRDGDLPLSLFSSIPERLLKEKDDIIQNNYFVKASDYFRMHPDRQRRYAILDHDLRLRIMQGDDPQLEATALYVLPYFNMSSDVAHKIYSPSKNSR